uniref:Uncharacterized protein n=1 Tax=Myoviridae sp. ctNQV2 TaxID=2827683 RepID=A0A8S5RZ34_9CAUD|nr:MAG TPA: hypothetical protein [Myoviridae sp. ctNQV2]
MPNKAILSRFQTISPYHLILCIKTVYLSK